MARHRFLDQLRPEPVPAVPALASGFMACPLVLQAAGGLLPWQQQVYELAYEQARAVVRPSLLERWQAANAN